MHDLFGESIELPARRPRSSSGLGTQRQHPQVQPALPIPTAAQEIAALDEGAEIAEALADLSLREVVEQYLEDQNLPYVDVAKVQDGLFARTRLEAFDFVVSAPQGHNWLLYAAPLSVAAREDLREWERIFGPGFTALITEELEDDGDLSALTFRTLDGEKVALV